MQINNNKPSFSAQVLPRTKKAKRIIRELNAHQEFKELEELARNDTKHPDFVLKIGHKQDNLPGEFWLTVVNPDRKDEVKEINTTIGKYAMLDATTKNLRRFYKNAVSLLAWNPERKS